MPRISSLSAASRLVGTEVIPVVQSGATVKATVTQLRGESSIDPYNLRDLSLVPDCTAELQALIDDCFCFNGSALTPHGRDDTELNKPFILPNGLFNISSPLVIPPVRGAVIRGAHRFATLIFNTAGGGIFQSNGVEYSYIGEMMLYSSGSDPLFDLDWDGGAGIAPGGTALQSNTFSDIYFQGGSHGLRIGDGGSMGSENLIQNCFFDGQSVAGLSTENANALQQTVIGGNFQSCDIGILVNNGSVPVIHGVGFQLSTTFDIKVIGNAGNAYSVLGCRSESLNFVSLGNRPPITLANCSHLNNTNGIFLGTDGYATIDCCVSTKGTIEAHGGVFLRGNSFGRTTDLLASSDTVVMEFNNLKLASPETGSASLRFGLYQYSVIECTSGSAQTITISNNATWPFDIGTEFEFIQIGAGTVTLSAGSGVTIHGPTSTAAQYGGLKLRKRATDEWITRAI